MKPIRSPRLRRLTVLWVVAVTSAAAVPAVGRTEPARAPLQGDPNVLLIVTDDQRARGSLSVMPAVKRWFGDGGRRFGQAFATTPTCCPSRASIFTGMYAHNHGVLTSEPGQAEKLDQSTTVQRQLHRAGYRTALFGKYLNAWDVNDPPPDFDRWGMFGDKTRLYYRGGKWNVNGVVRRVRTYSTVFVKQLALGFIREAEQADGEPWMMVLAPMAPHGPAIPQRRDASADLPPFEVTPDMTEENRSDKPPHARGRGPSLARMRALRARQLRTLMSVDRMVDALHSALAEAGELGNTLAFYTSDNGFMWGEHGLTGKGVAYDPAVHVPLFVTWPQMIPPGTATNRLVANIDIAPTIYDAVGITPPVTVDGRSLLTDFRRTRLLLEHWRRANRDAPNWAAQVTHDHKYIESYSAEHLVISWLEYYNLRRDPWELDNLLNGAMTDIGAVGTNTVATMRRDLVCKGTEGPTACP